MVLVRAGCLCLASIESDLRVEFESEEFSRDVEMLCKRVWFCKRATGVESWEREDEVEWDG